MRLIVGMCCRDLSLNQLALGMNDLNSHTQLRMLYSVFCVCCVCLCLCAHHQTVAVVILFHANAIEFLFKSFKHAEPYKQNF